MAIALIIGAWLSGYAFRWLQDMDKEVCPRVERGYNCKGDLCEQHLYRRG